MLKIQVEGRQLYDSDQECFITTADQILELEHSLISISKWQAKWKKPFLSTTMTKQQNVDYIRCMTINKVCDDNIYNGLSAKNYEQISKYIQDTMSATWFAKKQGQGKSNKVITSQQIYGWMIELNIPFECQKWHLNRLLTLIRVCGQQQAPTKKMSKRDIYAQNKALNAARRKGR